MDLRQINFELQNSRLQAVIKVKSLNSATKDIWNDGLKKLEAEMDYPYGNDSFKIDHGDSYYSFFDRLGKPHFNIALDGSNVIACGCGVIRSIPRDIHSQNAGFQKAWYLCDLKVHPTYRNQGIPGKLFRKKILSNYLRCSRAYAISMNPSKGRNTVIKLIENFPFIPFRYAATLCFFEISMKEVKSVEKDVDRIIGEKVRFLSLKGMKDIILESSGAPMPLFHAQYGPMASRLARKIEHEGRYMFCTTENSTLFSLLKKHFDIAATASILEHRLNNQCWDFILSSDI